MTDDANVIISDLIIKDKERYTKLVGKFMKMLPAFIEEFTEPVEKQDYVTLKSIAHRLKGAGGNFGFMQLTNICKEMEGAIADNNTEQVNTLYKQLTDTRDKILAGWDSN